MAAQLGATINLDDITHIDFLDTPSAGIPETDLLPLQSRRCASPGRTGGLQVMDNPGDAKYGMTREQMSEAFSRLKRLGAKEFGIHAFLASQHHRQRLLSRPGPASCSSWP